MSTATDRLSAAHPAPPGRFARGLSIATGLLAIVTCVVLLVERPSAREVTAPVVAAPVMAAHPDRDPSVPQARGDRNLVPEELMSTF